MNCGPASFNAESTGRGNSVISIDPLYRLDSGTIRERIAATYDQILEQTRRNSDQFVWQTVRSIDDLAGPHSDAGYASILGRL